MCVCVLCGDYFPNEINMSGGDTAAVHVFLPTFALPTKWKHIP